MSYQEYSTDFPQKQQFIVRWLEPGISRFREAADIPKNLISDQTVQRTCEAISDDLLIKTAEDLGLANSSSLEQATHRLQDLNVALATTEAQNTMHQWTAKHQPLMILSALAKAVSKLTPHIIEGNVEDAYRTIRVLFVLALAPFSSNSGKLLSQFGAILNCHEPHRMILKFTGSVMRGDVEAIEKMDNIILSNSQPATWSSFTEQAQSLAPQCWGKFVVSRQPGDPSPWNAMWDSLLKQEE